MAKKRLVLFYAIMFVFSILSVGFLGEVMLRLVYDDLPPEDSYSNIFGRESTFDLPYMRPSNSGFMWSTEYREVELSSNSAGYRDADWNSKKQKPIMILGDSFGWGWGCHADSMITSQLGMAYRACSFYNLCIPGDDLYSMFLRYQLHKHEINPEEIVIINYINDFFKPGYQDSVMHELVQKNLDFMKIHTKITFPGENNSAFMNGLQSSFLFRYLVRWFRMNISQSSSGSSQENLLRKGFKNDIKFFKNADHLKLSLDLYRMILEELSTNSKVTIVYIPPHYAVDEKKLNQLVRLFPNDTLHPELVGNALKKVATSLNNVTFIDLTEFLRKQNNVKPVYFELDSHLSPFGQKSVGQYLVSKELF